MPRAYETWLVPLLFAPYADEMAGRIQALSPRRVLEIAAGTGVLTRAMAARLPDAVGIVATDLNPPMLEHAAATGTARPIEWRPADAQSLPFADAEFDVVVCQFGAMFFPDRPRAYAQARRVLRPGGTFLFSTWTSIRDNELADVVQGTLAAVFPQDPPLFMERTPHGYFDAAQIERDLAAAGFPDRPRIETLTLRSRAKSARDAAIAYCQGTPLRGEIEARGAPDLAAATDAAERAIAHRFGAGAIDAKMGALIVTVARGGDAAQGDVSSPSS
ncbi:MAG TPA: class I SAM-dependent methyltransferase [Thermoanaerobaculia bacterium]|nr:class I SAM-dependent methyltransferase [Thermoanaerobaculia bacterium]